MSNQRSSTALRFLGTRHDVADLAALDTTILKTGACVYVEGEHALFVLRKESMEIADGVNIVAPMSSEGRWYRLTLASLVNNDSSVPGAKVSDALNNLLGIGSSSLVTDWYVDPVNGSDTNDGLSVDTAFASYRPLSQRIGSPMTVIKQDTTIHVLNDIPDSELPFTFQGIVVTPFILRLVQENPTVLMDAATLGTVQNIVHGTTRPSIQLNPPVDFTTAGPGSTTLVGHRFRKLSGPGAANVGTLFWLEAVDDGDPTIGYVSRPQFAYPPEYATNESLATGDVYVVEELGVMGKLEITPRDNQVVNFATTTTCVSVENGRGIATEGPEVASAIGAPGANTAGVCVHGCFVNYGRLYADFTNIQACRWGSTKTSLYCGRLAYLTGCSVQGDVQFGGSGGLALFNSVSFSGAALRTESLPGIPSYLFWDAVSFWNWSGAAFFANTGQGTLRGLLWGSSSEANSYGIDISALGRFTYTATPTVSGAAAFDYDIGGVRDTYANSPLPVISPANNAMLVATA